MTLSIDGVSTLLRYRNVKTNVIDHEKHPVSLYELSVQCPSIDQTTPTIHLLANSQIKQDKISKFQSELQLSTSTRLRKIKINNEITMDLE